MPVEAASRFEQVEQDAIKLLEARRIKAPTIWWVDSQAILYTRIRYDGERPFTAWLSEDHDAILRIDPGFVAEY